MRYGPHSEGWIGMSLTVKVVSEDGRSIIDEAAHLRAFESGSIGYNVAGRVNMDGRTYMVSCSLTEVGSKERKDDDAVALRDALRAKLEERQNKAGGGALAQERAKTADLARRLAEMERAAAANAPKNHLRQ